MMVFPSWFWISSPVHLCTVSNVIHRAKKLAIMAESFVKRTLGMRNSSF